eukprot:COSAG01_NODE_4544_length_4933_cov_1.648324_2_plen_196_part_00
MHEHFQIPQHSTCLATAFDTRTARCLGNPICSLCASCERMRSQVAAHSSCSHRRSHKQSGLSGGISWLRRRARPLAPPHPLYICAQGRGIPSRMQPSPSPPPCHSRQHHAYTPVKAWCRLPSRPSGLWAAGTHVTRRCGRPCTVVARGRTVWSAPAPGWTRSHSSTACGVVQATATLHRAHDDLVMRARSSRRHA